MKKLVSDAVVSVVQSVVSSSRKGTWTGTMTDLAVVLSHKVARDQRKELPGSPSALRVALNSVLKRLRKGGVKASFHRTTDSSRTRLVTFSR